MKRTIATAALFLATMSSGAGAQSPAPAATARAVADVPFGVGERAEYRITYGILGKRGEAATEVLGVEDIRGRPSYHLAFWMRGGALGWSMNDLQESWLDVQRMYAHRFKQQINQTTYDRLRTLDFYPADSVWRMVEAVREGPLATDVPLDDVSFLYWARTLPFEAGQTYEFNRYYKPEGNPVVLKVLRRERVEVPAGTFNTVVVQPLIRTSGMFGDGGRAEVYFTDDDRRLIVLIKTRMSIGTMQLQLEKYTPGEKYAGAR